MPRWNHPKMDWGLMSKFKTQGPVYAKEAQWESAYQDAVKKHHETQTFKREEEERILRETVVPTHR